MFEKLKEYALYIILWLIALWALAYAYLNTTNSQKGSDVLSSVQDTLISAVSKNDKVIAKTTVVDHMSDLNGISIGQYKIDATKAYFVNTNWDTDAISWEFAAAHASLPAAATTTGVWKLQLVLMPNEAVKGITATDFVLEANWVVNGHDNSDASEAHAWTADEQNEIMRWFLAYGYVGFGTFADVDDAKDFRDSYFSTWITVTKNSATEALVFVELAR